MQVVVDIDGDGSFLMNCQELATAAIEKMDIKMFILNNQHLGMVVQWEDRFYKVRPPVLNAAVWPSQLLCQNPAWCVWCSRPWPRCSRHGHGVASCRVPYCHGRHLLSV